MTEKFSLLYPEGKSLPSILLMMIPATTFRLNIYASILPKVNMNRM